MELFCSLFEDESVETKFVYRSMASRSCWFIAKELRAFLEEFVNFENIDSILKLELFKDPSIAGVLWEEKKNSEENTIY